VRRVDGGFGRQCGAFDAGGRGFASLHVRLAAGWCPHWRAEGPQ
jgi:hypothetical protein